VTAMADCHSQKDYQTLHQHSILEFLLFYQK
jgi:hypothetical protein